MVENGATLSRGGFGYYSWPTSATGRIGGVAARHRLPTARVATRRGCAAGIGTGLCITMRPMHLRAIAVASALDLLYAPEREARAP